MTVAMRRRVNELRGDREGIRRRLSEMRGGGAWSDGKRAEYGALMRELRRMEGLTDGLRLERDEFDEYLRRRREEDAKWRGTRTVESPVIRRSSASAEHGARLMDENRRLRQQLRQRGGDPGESL